MFPKVSDIIRLMETIAPLALAEPWDNVGLQVGAKGRTVRRVWVCLDATLQVVKAAVDNRVDLLVTHHPLFFKPLSRIDLESPMGRIVDAAVRHEINIYSAHTNLDSVRDGLNDLLAEHIGMMDTGLLGESRDDAGIEGIGRYGKLREPRPLGRLAGDILAALGIAFARVVGDPGKRVEEVAICTGSAASLIPNAMGVGAQALVGGDFGYHAAMDAEAAGLGLIDIGHFGSEHFMVEVLAGRLNALMAKEGFSAKAGTCPLEKDPFILLQGAMNP